MTIESELFTITPKPLIASKGYKLRVVFVISYGIGNGRAIAPLQLIGGMTQAMQDFSKPWTDEELYAKYSLTEEEIAFIESMIKPME